MENTQKNAVEQLHNYAANLILREGKTPDQVTNLLMEKGLDETSARNVVNNVLGSLQQTEEKKKSANKNMIYGALWCVGGTVATLADIGLIFWGAIVFGGIQFIIGVSQAASK